MSRWAVFRPIPGSLASSVISSSIALTGQNGGANGSEGTFRISAWSSSAARRCASATAASTRSPRNSASCSWKTAGIDRDRADGAAAVGGDPDHAAAGGGLDGPAGQLGLKLLKPALHLLAELKELLKICHAFR